MNYSVLYQEYLDWKLADKIRGILSIVIGLIATLFTSANNNTSLGETAVFVVTYLFFWLILWACYKTWLQGKDPLAEAGIYELIEESFLEEQVKVISYSGKHEYLTLLDSELEELEVLQEEFAKYLQQKENINEA